MEFNTYLFEVRRISGYDGWDEIVSDGKTVHIVAFSKLHADAQIEAYLYNHGWDKYTYDGIK